MIPNKHLKAFIRYTDRGQLVPGSTVMRESMPKVGRWREIITDECCTYSTTTTSTTNLYCNNHVCITNMAIGSRGNTYGYSTTVLPGIGQLSPNCLNITDLYWTQYNVNLKGIVLITSSCYTAVTIWIDGVEFSLIATGGENTWGILKVDNPFSNVGQISEIVVCADLCN